jgi:hypothetical protein
VLGRTVVVLGTATASTARAVLGLGSIVAGFSPVHIVPYIPIADPRFAGLAESPKGIIGVSSPIAPSLFPPDLLTVRVGFEPDDECKCRGCFSRARMWSADLARNTEMLSAAVGQALEEMAKTDPLHFRRGEMCLRVWMGGRSRVFDSHQLNCTFLFLISYVSYFLVLLFHPIISVYLNISIFSKMQRE